MATVLTPPRPPVAKSNGNGTAHAASKSNGNGAHGVGYTKQDAELLRKMVLEQVAKGEITIDQAAVELRDLMDVRSFGQLRCKVSEKGALSVYGLQKQWPVTLYADQWERLFAVAEEIKVFIKEHATELNRKERSQGIAVRSQGTTTRVPASEISY